jgi:hypothetical protein
MYRVPTEYEMIVVGLSQGDVPKASAKGMALPPSGASPKEL